MIEVTQADRDAADEFAGTMLIPALQHGLLEQAFAKHRLQSISSQAERIEVLEGALDSISRRYSNGASAQTLVNIARAALASDGEVG